jgi:hypothetical protein
MGSASYIHILNIPQTFLTMGVKFIPGLIRKEEIVLHLEVSIEG